MDLSNYETLKVSTDPVKVKITDEPKARFTHRGYAPVVIVQVEDEGEEKLLYISSSSLANALNELVVNNDHKFTGLEFTIKKESTDKFAKYVLERD